MLRSTVTLPVEAGMTGQPEYDSGSFSSSMLTASYSTYQSTLQNRVNADKCKVARESTIIAGSDLTPLTG